MNAATRLTGIKQSISTFWNERNKREQNMLLAAMAVIALGLLYVLLIDPAMSGRADLETKLPPLRQQAAEVRALAKEVRSQPDKPAAAPIPPMTRESLEASLVRRGLNPQNVSISNDLAKLQLNGVSFSGVVDWLAEMQRTAGMSVLDAVIEAQAQIDTVNATLTLRQQRSE